MKTRFLFFALLAATLCFYGCEKTSSDDQNNSSDEKTDGGTSENGVDGTGELPSLPDLEDVDDVCTKMTDLEFMRYCYENFDVNGDAKVSMSEANAVKTISCSTAEDFTGIEYFPNLESFESYSAKYLDLRYNAKLTEINFCVGSTLSNKKSAPIEELDLRYCVNLTEIRNYTFYNCTGLTSVRFPSSLTSIGEYAFSYCYGLTKIEFPSGLTSIDNFAFYGCENLAIVTSRAISPPDVGAGFHSAGRVSEPVTFPFCECPSLVALYVPAESVEAYKDSNWIYSFEDKIFSIEDE